uniref:C2H2-type domain-containing protein n=1 Tax=Onchocerca volvulus TaxID=6282 RepID=A0A8R1XMC2_ONCVO
MSSEWSGCFYEEKLPYGVSECISISDLFYEPSSYDELCFYCIEGACCPYHEIPQPRMQVQQKEGCNAVSMNSVLDEIFSLHTDCYNYANYEINIVSNCAQNAAVNDQLNLAEQQSPQQSVIIDQNITQHKQTNVKSKTVTTCHQDQCPPTNTSNSNADVASKITYENVEEVFIIPKRLNTLRNTLRSRQKYQRFRNKQYLCDICDSAFTLKHNIQTHLLLYHPNNETYTKRRRGRRYRCLKCNTLFRTFDAVQKHQKRQHEVRMRPKCETCQKEFPTASLLREHVAIVHLNLRPFKCTKCSAVFGRQGCLRRHDMMRHLNYVYVCPYKQCTHAGFKCSKALTAHIRSVHTHVRPYKCEQCGKRFVRRNDLRVHSDIHNTACKYICPTCKQMFRRRIHFQKHIKKFHPKVEL